MCTHCIIQKVEYYRSAKTVNLSEKEQFQNVCMPTAVHCMDRSTSNTVLTLFPTHESMQHNGVVYLHTDILLLTKYHGCTSHSDKLPL